MAQYAIFLYSPRRSSKPPPQPSRKSALTPVAPSTTGTLTSWPSPAPWSLRSPWSRGGRPRRYGENAVTDGPFIEAKEVILGFYVIEAPDLDAALEIARRNPVLGDGGGLEVRPVAQGRVVGRTGRP